MYPSSQTAASSTPVQGLDQILRLPQVKLATGLGKSSIYNGVLNGTFPAPVALGARAIGWHQSSVESWLASRKPTSQKAAA